MPISDEEKRQIMERLARGNPEMPIQQQSLNLSQSEQKLDEEDYQNFDDFAQRDSPNERQQLFSKSFHPERTDLAMLNQIKGQIAADVNQAKETGQLRAERIREIVQAAVFQVASELKYGTSDIRLIAKDAISAVSQNLQDQGGEIKEEITASIEGAIEGISSWRRQSIAKTQLEVKRLQTKLDTEEDELQQEIARLLSDVEEVSQDTPPSIKASIKSAINALKNSEEMALMQKRYAQLQAQAAIIRANLAARYGGRHEEVKEHLDEAKTWYNQTHTQVEPLVDQVGQKRSQLDERLGDAGVALAKGERRIRQILSELLQSAAELLREKEPPSK